MNEIMTVLYYRVANCLSPCKIAVSYPFAKLAEFLSRSKFPSKKHKIYRQKSIIAS